jgi:hypothetical protein
MAFPQCAHRYGFAIFLAALFVPELHAQNTSVKPTATTANYTPVCSTEKINGDCHINVDRRYPITLPTLQMKPGSHITVSVFHPFPFETLTLDAGAPQAYEGSDQAAALVSAVVPDVKGAVLKTSSVDFEGAVIDRNLMAFATANPSLVETKTCVLTSNDATPFNIWCKITELNKELTDAMTPTKSYVDQSRVIYAQVRLMETAAPRALQDTKNHPFRSADVPIDTSDPWTDYSGWRTRLLQEIKHQGQDTTTLLDNLSGPCQKAGDAKPAQGPWLASPRLCNDDKPDALQASKTPLLKNGFSDLDKRMDEELDGFDKPTNDQAVVGALRTAQDELNQRKDHVAQWLNALPNMVAKISPDMQTLQSNIIAGHKDNVDVLPVGVIPDPIATYDPHNQPAETKVLAPYTALGRQVTYTLNGQNEIANSILTLPTTAQKQAVMSITAVYASPRLEVSTGAFFSFLPNRSYANFTDVAVVNGVPTSQDVRINLTTTSPPEVIPYVAGNIRLGNDFAWFHRRREAFYATAAVAVNPYNTQVEYAAGFSLSWRYLMFSPLYHLGHGIHLTQGEMNNQIWCQYGNGATSTSTPPACSGSPPAPSTKTFWRGAFAIGIGVRIPTSFASTNK